MEGVIYSLKDCLDLMTELGIPVTEVRATGGGARSPLWRQLQADVFGQPVHRTRTDNGPAFGAALLAGVAAGAYVDVVDACSVIQIHPNVDLPDPRRHDVYERYHAAFVDLYAATAPLMHRLTELSI
jgi:xylulokinase